MCSSCMRFAAAFAGQHGAKVVVMGRRQAVLDQAVKDLKSCRG